MTRGTYIYRKYILIPVIKNKCSENGCVYIDTVVERRQNVL